MIRKIAYISGGFIALGLATAGIVIRGLPTTPLLLLSAALFARGSKKLERWLLENRIFGKYINSFRSKGGMTIRLKLIAISTMWIMITISSFTETFEYIPLKILLISAGIIGTIVMGFAVKTVKI